MKNFIAVILVLCMPLFSYADTARDEGTNAGNSFLNTYGSKEGIRKLSNPLISGNTQLTTIDGSTSFNGQLLCPSSKNFMEISVVVSSYNDLSSVIVKQDLDMDGSGDSIYSVPFRVSGVCGNGVISCNPGTWDNCSYYKWIANESEEVHLQAVSLDKIGGCSCINDSCSYNAASHLDTILKTLGSGAAGAIQSKDPRYTITRTRVDGSALTFYGQDADSCSTVSSSYGSHDPEKYYKNPELIGTDALAEVATQKEDPQSYYSTIYHSKAWAKRNLEDSYVNCTIERTGLVVQKENLCSQPKPDGWLGGHEETKIYRVEYFYNWEVNDCNCYRTPGIDPELCISPPSATTTSSPPGGSELIGKGCEYHARDDKDGWDACLTAKYDYYKHCKRYSDVYEENINDSCSALEENCHLHEEVVDGITTYKDYNPTGKYPEPSCKTFTGAYGVYEICKPWWEQKRTYHCKKEGNTYDFSDAQKRMKVITSSVKDNTSDVYYEDHRKEDDGWSDSSHTVSLPNRESYGACEKACKVRKPKQDTQAGQAGHTGQFRTHTNSYDYSIKSCSPDNTCPLESGEEMVRDCQCLNDFNEAVTTMEILRQAGKDMNCDGEWNEGTCTGTIHIFSGHRGECRKPGTETNFFNCCNVESSSWLVFEENCTEEEKKTVQAWEESKSSHYIGTYCEEEMPLVGCVQEARVFCIFNSKLGRIIQEQGRLQLQAFQPDGQWGVIDDDSIAENCRGFTPEEFQMLDFSQMDFSEFYEDIETKAQSEIETEMEDRVKDFYDDIR